MHFSKAQFEEVGRRSSGADPASSGEARDDLVESCSLVKLIYLQVYVTKNKRGDTFFAEAAQSRMQNIRASNRYNYQTHKVHCPPIQDLGEIGVIVSRYIERYGGKGAAFCKEIGLFSHSALDGPIGTKPSTVDPLLGGQMGMDGWGAIDFNWWKDQPRIVVYGCNSANESYGDDKSFAKRISKLTNYSAVETWGQSAYSYPSFLPDYRQTTMARNMNTGWNVGKTYQVGGNAGEGWKATSPQSSYPPANPMNCYKNGAKVRSIHQGHFNDHRKILTLVSV